jgi:hypothetical protein
MFKRILFFLILLFSLTSAASETNKDKTKAALPTISKEQKLELRVYSLEHKLQMLAQGQLNYKIEKNLLKETYSNNYQLFNVIITIVLGIIGVIGFSGIRSINTTKKEYIEELAELKLTKSTFDNQIIEFNREKEEIDSSLKIISEENKHQNEQIKFLELKSKISPLIEADNLILALDFANAALLIYPTDTYVLQKKSLILIRLGKTEESCDVLKYCFENTPEDKVTMFNLVESLYFAGKIEDAKKIVSNHKKLFNEKCDGKLLEFFSVFELYHNGKTNDLKEKAISYVTFENMNKKTNVLGKGSGWALTEALFFIHYLKESDLKTIIRTMMFYWDGQISGKKLLTDIGIELPTKPIQENQVEDDK